MNDQTDISTARPSSAGTYLTEAEAAQFTRFAKGTLRNMRSGGRGPRYLKLDKAVRYRRSDLVEWLEHSDSASARSASG